MVHQGESLPGSGWTGADWRQSKKSGKKPQKDAPTPRPPTLRQEAIADRPDRSSVVRVRQRGPKPQIGFMGQAGGALQVTARPCGRRPETSPKTAHPASPPAARPRLQWPRLAPSRIPRPFRNARPVSRNGRLNSAGGIRRKDRAASRISGHQPNYAMFAEGASPRQACR